MTLALRKPPNPRKLAINRANKRDRRKLRDLKGVWPAVDPQYLAWLGDTQGCLLCDDMIDRRAFRGGIPWTQNSRTEAAHIGDRGMAQKSSSYDALPLCGGLHHRLGKESAHRLGKGFLEHHEINHAAVVATLNSLYVKHCEEIGREVPEVLKRRMGA